MFFMELMQENNEAPAHERKPGLARRSTLFRSGATVLVVKGAWYIF